jgi:ArsR family transcriptional regulator
MKQEYDQYAQVCQCLANSKRLEIISLLKDKELSVSDLLKRTGLLKANLSQHLGVLRSRGVVKTRKAGLAVYYSIANKKLIKACQLMREVFVEQANQRSMEMKKWSI